MPDNTDFQITIINFSKMGKYLGVGTFDPSSFLIFDATNGNIVLNFNFGSVEGVFV